MNEYEIKDASGRVTGKIFCEKAVWMESGDYESYRVTFPFTTLPGELRLHRGWKVERVK